MKKFMEKFMDRVVLAHHARKPLTISQQCNFFQCTILLTQVKEEKPNSCARAYPEILYWVEKVLAFREVEGQDWSTQVGEVPLLGKTEMCPGSLSLPCFHHHMCWQ